MTQVSFQMTFPREAVVSCREILAVKEVFDIRSRQSVHVFRVINVQGSVSRNRSRKHVIVLSLSNENAFLMAIKGDVGRRKE